jgi:hypothetical protein
MKIIGQSILVDAKPYLHLGYISATTVKPNGFFGAASILLALAAAAALISGGIVKLNRSPKTGIGVAGFAVGAIFVLLTAISTCVAVFAPEGLCMLCSFFFAFIALAILTVWGIVNRKAGPSFMKLVFAGGLALLIISLVVGFIAFGGGEKVFRSPGRVTESNALDWLGAVSTSGPTTGPDAEFTTDGWNHPMRLSSRMKNGREVFVVTSAGPDGVFGTPDDIVFRRVERAEPVTQGDEAKEASP